jgi:beta-galactosidase
LETPFYADETVVWENITIPHSWNTEDILDDEDGYYLGEGGFQYQ